MIIKKIKDCESYGEWLAQFGKLDSETSCKRFDDPSFDGYKELVNNWLEEFKIEVEKRGGDFAEIDKRFDKSNLGFFVRQGNKPEHTAWVYC